MNPFLTENDIRFHASTTLADGRILLAVPDAGSVIRIWQFDLAGQRLIAPAEMPDNRIPGPRHASASFVWRWPGSGPEKLFLFYSSRPEGADSGPFPLTWYELPWTRPSAMAVHNELVRIRKIVEDAGKILDAALPG